MASLIHRWQLTENANDSVGTLHLTNNGSVTFGADGASFNGSSQWLSGTVTIPPTGTLSIWVVPTAWTGTRCVSGWLNTLGDNGMGVQGNSSWFPTKMGAFNYANSGNYGYIESRVFNSTNYPSDVPTLILFKWDSTTIYLRDNNGTELSSVRGVAASVSDFSIGRLGSYNSLFWSGAINDCRIYDYKTSSAEDAALSGGSYA